MELVRGTTLRKRLDEQHVLETPEVVAIGVQVADALDTAHRAHVVHRDIKPANILLSTDERVLVADFGIAKAFEGADLTVDGAMIGTAKYLAPEQVEGGPVDGRTDLYSLGVVLYEALCGRPPVRRRHRHGHGHRPAPPGPVAAAPAARRHPPPHRGRGAARPGTPPGRPLRRCRGVPGVAPRRLPGTGPRPPPGHRPDHHHRPHGGAPLRHATGRHRPGPGRARHRGRGRRGGAHPVVPRDRARLAVAHAAHRPRGGGAGRGRGAVRADRRGPPTVRLLEPHADHGRGTGGPEAHQRGALRSRRRRGRGQRRGRQRHRRQAHHHLAHRDLPGGRRHHAAQAGGRDLRDPGRRARPAHPEHHQPLERVERVDLRHRPAPGRPRWPRGASRWPRRPPSRPAAPT